GHHRVHQCRCVGAAQRRTGLPVPRWQAGEARAGGAMTRPRNVIAFGAVFVVLALMFVLSACTKAAAQPRPDVLLADARVGAVCAGPTTMAGCLVSVYDSTAGASLASN